MSVEDFLSHIERNTEPFDLDGFREYNNVIFNLDYNSLSNDVHLVTLLSKNRNNGDGTNFMNFLIETADTFEVNLFLSAVPLSLKNDVISKDNLIKFYKKFGFEILENEKLIRYCERTNSLML